MKAGIAFYTVYYTYMEQLPGVTKKAQEYATRINAGEDINKVLEGAETFRPLVEALVEKKENNKSASLDDIPSRKEDSDIDIQKRIAVDNEKVAVLTDEISDLFAHKQSDWNDPDHQQAIGIYNTMMNIGKGISEGLKEAFDPKVQQYVQEIRSGKPKAYVLSGAPKSIVDAVEKQLLEESTREQSGENLEIPRETIEELRNDLEKLSQDYYFLTHQTYVDFAKKINTEGFSFQGGGLNTTTLAQGVEGITLSLQKMEAGESHRNSDSMVVFAIPKKEYAQYAGERKFGPDEFADMLLDTKLDEVQKSGSLRIPHSYILGVYEKSKGFLPNKK